MSRVCKGGGGPWFSPETGEAGLLADFCDVCGMNPHVVWQAGGKVGMAEGILSVGFPLFQVEPGAVCPWNIVLSGWLVSCDGEAWAPVHAADGVGGSAGIVGPAHRLLRAKSGVVLCATPWELLELTRTVPSDIPVFLVPEQPAVTDLEFLVFLAERHLVAYVVSRGFSVMREWLRVWLRFLRQAEVQTEILFPEGEGF
ncbi:MAG: hypothetical protein Q4D98_09970 [Planctomycetia bacterium]|nr:hypothetical protein [Planctomycetia bacterium]